MVPILCRGSSRISSRLFPSLVLFGSFTLLGIFISALGPAVPSLSRDLGVAETSFGTTFSLRGLGYLLGSWCSSLTWVHMYIQHTLCVLFVGLMVSSITTRATERRQAICVFYQSYMYFSEQLGSWRASKLSGNRKSGIVFSRIHLPRSFRINCSHVVLP